MVNVNTFAQAGGNLSVVTSGSDGTAWVQCPDRRARSVAVINRTGVTILVRQDGAGEAMPVSTGTGFVFNGISNASQLEVKREDEVATGVTVNLRWEA